MDDGEVRRHPAAERLAGERRPVDLQGVHEAADVADVVVDQVGLVGLAGEAVAEHVDRVDVEVLAVRREVAGIRLGMAAGAVKEDQRRLAFAPRVQVAGADAVDVDVGLFEGHALQVGPEAGVGGGHGRNLAVGDQWDDAVAGRGICSIAPTEALRGSSFEAQMSFDSGTGGSTRGARGSTSANSSMPKVYSIVRPSGSR